MNLIPMEVLNQMIAGGWGSTRRDRIPDDWRTRRGPNPVKIEDADLKLTGAEKMQTYRQRHPEKVKIQKQQWRERQRSGALREIDAAILGIGKRESAA